MLFISQHLSRQRPILLSRNIPLSPSRNIPLLFFEKSSTSACMENSTPVSEEIPNSNFEKRFSSTFEESFRSSLEISRCKIMNLLVIGPGEKLYTRMIGVNGSHHFQEIKQHPAMQKQSLNKTDIYPNTLMGLNNSALTFTVLPWHTYVTKGKSGLYTGYFIKLMDIIVEKLNFSYHIIEPDDGKYGSLQNGTWTGTVQTAYKYPPTSRSISVSDRI